MKRLFISLTALAFSAVAQAAPIGIASASPNGTNYPMVEDIKRVCSTTDSPITNVVSDGSLDNIFKIYNDKSTQYGIVQADALKFQQGRDPKMMERIMMVFPFFSTEMHVIVKDSSPVRGLADLAGKNVVEGPEGSGTWVSVQVIKALTSSKWNAFHASQAEGMQAVLNGQADAMFIVAGAPVGIIQKTAGIRLLPLSHPKLDEFGLYTKTMIPSGTYPAIKTSVSTYKVDNVLATFAFRNQYQKEIGDLVTCITRKLPELQRDTKSHPKWRDVDPLDINRIKWPAHPAALAAIRREAKSR